MTAPDTLNVQQAAAMLHADDETVLGIARSGELPGTKIGRSWVFMRTDLLAFLQQRVRADTERRRQLAATPALPAALVVPPVRSRRRTALPALLPLPSPPARSRSP